MRVILGSVMVALMSTAAMAGSTVPTPVSEPGMIGIVAGGVIAALAIARLRGRK